MKTAKLAFAIGLAFLVSGTAYARPDAVPGAACTACHEKGAPSKANVSAKAAGMLKTHKDLAKCKDCHSKGADGKLANKSPDKK